MSKKLNFVELNYGDAQITFFEFIRFPHDQNSKRWHQHIFYELHFPLTNPVKCTFGDRTVIVSPGEVIIIPPGTLHQSITGDCAADEITVLSLELCRKQGGQPFFDDFVSALEGAALTAVKVPDLKADLLKAFLQDSLYSSVLGVCHLKMCASQVIDSLMGRILCDKPLKNDERKVWLMVDNLLNISDITLAEIAAVTNYSERQVSRLIKQQYGVSFSQLRSEQKKGKKTNEN